MSGMFFDFYKVGQAHFMKETDFRDVPDELWEHIEPLLVPFKRKRSGGSKPLS